MQLWSVEKQLLKEGKCDQPFSLHPRIAFSTAVSMGTYKYVCGACAGNRAELEGCVQTRTD